MDGIKKKFGPLANLEFDKLFLGQVFSHFADAIVQFLLVATLLQMSGSAGKSIALPFIMTLIALVSTEVKCFYLNLRDNLIHLKL